MNCRSKSVLLGNHGMPGGLRGESGGRGGGVEGGGCMEDQWCGGGGGGGTRYSVFCRVGEQQSWTACPAGHTSAPPTTGPPPSGSTPSSPAPSLGSALWASVVRSLGCAPLAPTLLVPGSAHCPAVPPTRTVMLSGRSEVCFVYTFPGQLYTIKCQTFSVVGHLKIVLSYRA